MAGAGRTPTDAWTTIRRSSRDRDRGLPAAGAVVEVIVDRKTLWFAAARVPLYYHGRLSELISPGFLVSPANDCAG